MAGVDEAREALGRADEAFARSDVEVAVAELSTAIRGFTAAGAQRDAAMACVRLGNALAHGIGNLTAGRAWFARAQRLVAAEPPCVEQGWVAVAAMGCDVPDPAELLAAAELALDRARRFGDVNLETKALADAGLAHVQAGRVREGMGLLDEAMALACGPADDSETAAKSVCSFFTACYYATDFERANTWADLLRRQGLIGVAPGGPAFLSSHCNAVQAALLVEMGRWGEAEAVLLRAKADFEATMRAPAWHPDIALADLRIRQGRLAEAESLLLGKDQAMQALLPAARLHLARGDHPLALAAARRGLRGVRDDRLRAVELLAVLVSASLAVGDVTAAAAAATDLRERAGDLDIPALQARAALTHARVHATAAAGDGDGDDDDDDDGGGCGEAIVVLESALDRLDLEELPWLRVCLLLDLARLRERTGDVAGAKVDASAAAAVLAALDVQLGAEDTALLARLGHGAPGADGHVVVQLVADGRWWSVTCDGTGVRLRDSKGLRYLAVLLAAPGQERHVLDLVDRVEGVAPRPSGGERMAAGSAICRRALGDAGELVDGQARTAYRRRIEELRGAAEDAIAAGRLDEAEAHQAELDQLVAHLAQAFGLGGRDRRAASAAERARLNVTRALRSAIAKLAEALPTSGDVLDRRVRTGLYCVFAPDDADRVRWIVQSPMNGTALR